MRVICPYAVVLPIRVAIPDKGRRSSRVVPAPEPLEERKLLSFLQPFGNKFVRVRSGGVLDMITVSGPGQVFARRAGRNKVAISLAGTTQDSQVTVSSLGAQAGKANSPLQVANIKVQTHRLGSFQGPTTVDLTGRLSPLLGPITSLQFDALLPGAQINVSGNLGTLTINRGVDLGPNGHINVTNDLTGSLSVSRDLVLDGGQINIGRDLSGALSVGGNLTIDDGGKFLVARNLGATTATSASSSGTASTTSAGGGATVTGNLTVDSGASLIVQGNVSSLLVGGNVEASSGGSLEVGGNLTAFTINGGGGAPSTGNLVLNPGGAMTVGQNLSSLSVGSNLQLFQNSQMLISGSLTSVTIGGNLQTSGGGELQVVGNVGALSVTGLIQGKGSSDIAVGDNLAQLTVLGGGSGEQGLQSVNLLVTNNIEGIDIRNGIANSLIQAGFVINGGTPGTGANGWNIGPSGAVSPSSVDPNTGQIAVLNSTIQAGYEIMNMTIGGDVVSDRPVDPNALPTRIIAGENLQGQIQPNGVIDSFQIVGSLINSVLAASVGPNPVTQFYDQPAGVIEVGFTAATSPGSSTLTPAPPNVNVQTSGVTNVNIVTSGYPTLPQAAQLQTAPVSVFTAPPFESTSDPELPAVLPGGAINPSFAPKLQLVPPVLGAGSELPLPSKSTVLGSVITTTPGTGDYAGIFAANTNGVLVEPVPTTEPVSPG